VPSKSISLSWWHRRSIRTVLLKATFYTIAGAGAVILLGPIFWSVSTAFKEVSDIMSYPPRLIPQPIVWKNFIYAFTKAHIGAPMVNSFIIGCLCVIGQVFSCSLTAYGFARLRFPGRNILFVAVLATMMIPFYVVMIPQFILYGYLGWIDSWKPLIVPSLFASGGFFIFLLRQFFLTLPFELDDAARMDGCNTWGIYWRIIMPLSLPALSVVAIYTFISKWTELLGPLIYINSKEKWTVSLRLAVIYTPAFLGMDLNIIMMSSLISTIPLVILFFAFQRLFIQGIVITGVKG